MTTQDLTNNKERIIRNIKGQITLATFENIKSIMVKMLAMLPQFASEKATLKNINKLTTKATLSYIKNDIQFTAIQSSTIDANYAIKQQQSLPSNLQY